MNESSLHKPLIGISLGDINGIGPEVVMKALSDARLLDMMTPIVYGSTKVVGHYRKVLKMHNFQYHHMHNTPEQGQINVINCWQDAVEIQMGQSTPEGGKAALLALQKAVEDLKGGIIEGIVTAPINKHNIQSEDFKFPGHTEYFTKAFETRDSLMLLCSGNLRVGVVTGHVPLKEVPRLITRERVQLKLNILERSLKQDFGINKPRIALLGLNPHAGEEGLLGKEEEEVLIPLIGDAKNRGRLVFGPFPADGFFGSGAYNKFDGILAMYHDQGLIPFKTLAFEQGVNYTAGLPIVRTSPDHGTAYDIAGQNLASESSMREALYLACDIARKRREKETVKS
ncbi:4-hydroxythreonine-4-phosphate dehydrogenase PdxA [Cesiribacter andamanensis]|uniref:4-hydroxythreonine-4-phosphate dehydrogenase 2 n=1 Tax=Cesiribacter andamanensis AMV16 TaxID=1279009 RepID=M7N654_9BACT|nr:4-hydroxythreonine-4-phosphate dehydrogenase PdxA [Cesiribacter andamanensis]EMR02716.1 4-hydroxythreonine-4-phosphate dehydrogenase 2 [Cesiribacter andamanensis AMV16]